MTSQLSQQWPLGQQPTIATPIPERMEALVIHRDRYGPPGDVIHLETVAVPELHPEDATRVLVSILASGPNGEALRVAGNPIKFTGEPESDHRYPPMLGADNCSVLSALLGLPADRIDELRRGGAFGAKVRDAAAQEPKRFGAEH